ncbi:MAG: glycosyltransferase family 2 protein [bacterium]|nr:glycosyltransferase family 2 protein [bacterium]
MNSPPSVAILLLNYRGWNDTIECLESLFRMAYSSFRIIVVDNNSEDGSLDKIGLWAKGKLNHYSLPNHPCKQFTFPPIEKPIPLTIVNSPRNETAVIGSNENQPRLTLIQSDANRGYAAGNNIGLRFILEHTESEFVWLLNNDTVVKPDALSKLVERFQANHSTGICGSTLLYYDDPELVQARGGAWFKHWFAYTKHIGVFTNVNTSFRLGDVERDLDYVSGASMLLSRPFLEEVGLMEERYFLYFEEIDWATRAKRQGFQLRYAPESIVYHKEGAVTGANNRRGSKTLLTDFYGQRNRLLFTRKHYPVALPTVWLAMLASVGVRCLRRKYRMAWQLLQILFGKRTL